MTNPEIITILKQTLEVYEKSMGFDTIEQFDKHYIHRCFCIYFIKIIQNGALYIILQKLRETDIKIGGYHFFPVIDDLRSRKLSYIKKVAIKPRIELLIDTIYRLEKQI